MTGASSVSQVAVLAEAREWAGLWGKARGS